MQNLIVGDYISELRKRKGLTQVKLAEIIDVSDKALSKWERGEGLPDVGNLRSLATALDSNVDAILNGGPIKLSTLLKSLGAMDDINWIKYICISVLSLIIALKGLSMFGAFILMVDTIYSGPELYILGFTILGYFGFSILLHSYFYGIIYDTKKIKVSFIYNVLKCIWFGPIAVIVLTMLNSMFLGYYDSTISITGYLAWAYFCFKNIKELLNSSQRKTVR